MLHRIQMLIIHNRVIYFKKCKRYYNSCSYYSGRRSGYYWKWGKLNMYDYSQEEHYRCQKVAKAFKELYDLYGDMCVVDTGKFGFVELTFWDRDGARFEDNKVYIDSNSLFEELWGMWQAYYVYEYVKETKLENISWNEQLSLLPENIKLQFKNKRKHFIDLAELKK